MRVRMTMKIKMIVIPGNIFWDSQLKLNQFSLPNSIPRLEKNKTKLDISKLLKFASNANLFNNTHNQNSNFFKIVELIKSKDISALNTSVYDIIIYYYGLLSSSRSTANPRFLRCIDEYIKDNQLSHQRAAMLRQLAQIILRIKEGTQPVIDIQLFKEFLSSEQTKVILRGAVLCGAKVSMPESLSQEASHLTILTEVSWGTLGDYNAAARLIRLIQASQPNLLITWVIKGRIEEIPNELESSATLDIHKITDWKQLFSSELIITSLSKTAAILIFPTFHFLTDKQIKTLKQRFNVPMISCLEYSYDSNQSNPDLIELKAGLGKDEMGIFIFPPNDKHPLTQIDSKQPILRVLFQHSTIFDYAEDSLPPYTQVSEEQAKAYDASHTLFFGYTNRDISRVTNPGMNLGNFLKTVLSIAENQPEKNVDVILPINLSQLHDAKIDYTRYSAVSFIHEDENGPHQEVIYQNSQPSLPQLRIINLFRFENHTFTQLVAASHPFKLCTGDQSLSDVISVENAVVFYQVMEWKQLLAFNYIEIAKTALEEAKIDPSLSVALPFLKEVYQMRSFDLEKIKSFLNNPQLLDEFKLIHRFIFENKNLNKTLPKNLLTFLQYLKNEEKLLGDMDSSPKRIRDMESQRTSNVHEEMSFKM